MPTTHVQPDSHEELQGIANALLKARKVVVVTGAGISTNSGIPVCYSVPRFPAQHFRVSQGREKIHADLRRTFAPRTASTR